MIYEIAFHHRASSNRTMASPGDGGGKDEVKTQFDTREGPYKLMPLSEYSKPTRAVHNGQGNYPVRLSFIDLKDSSGSSDRICFNVGRELYIYQYKGVRKAADLTKPIDKRVYKGTFPTCHDFNFLTATEYSVLLLVGFTAGQIQLIDPMKKDYQKLYNDERVIEKTKVTCIKWIPGSPNQFLVSYSSGQLYVYNEELPCGQTPPNYQLFKHGDGYSIYTCKTKSTRNPLYRWVIGEGAINEFAFAPCAKYLAIVSEDGYLRVFDYNSMELVGTMRSYFGGFLCVCWSPDSKYIVTGGEDDLVTVWSFLEKRVICRGNGHKSWVNIVAFDPYTTSIGDDIDTHEFYGSEEDFHPANKSDPGLLQETLRASVRSSVSRGSRASTEGSLITYRFGSVGQDAQLCLWDLTEDILRQPMGRKRTSTVLSNSPKPGLFNNTGPTHANPVFREPSMLTVAGTLPNSPKSSNASTSFAQKFTTLALGERGHNKEVKEHKRNFSLGSKSVDRIPALKPSAAKLEESVRLLGTNHCPRLDEVSMLEPMVCKKIAHERLTALVFKEECLVTACQEGYICTWARPGKANLAHQMSSPQQQHSPHGSTAL